MSYWQLDVPRLVQTAHAVRETQGLSQRALARKLGLSSSTITRLNYGQRPDADTLLALCKWLNADLRDFAMWHADKEEKASE
jgi:transcriptional regulator with XRE-family HTH domain